MTRAFATTIRTAGASLVALGAGLCAALSCAPSTGSPPAAPPAELAPSVPETPNVSAAPEPDEPPIPVVSAGPPGPLEMALPASEERLASDVGLLIDRVPPVLSLELAPCRFEAAEPEFAPEFETALGDIDHCRELNRATFDSRTQRAIVVSPGTYVIEVTNHSFDRDLGLWLRRADAPERALVAAGGVARGLSRHWTVELVPGTYLYSCPLSPTPDYTLVVR